MKLTLEKFESEILRTIGTNDWDGIKSFVYSKDRSVIASLARSVIDLANSGDETATDIVLTAAEYLVDLVHQIELITGKRDLPVVFGGGISEAGELLIDAVNRGIGRKVTISELRMANRAAELAR
jgi:N-acetylglucosamine kinase-like BadF-type ATPase